MMSPIKSLFASNRMGHLSGMLLPALGSSSASASLLQPGAPAKLGGSTTLALPAAWSRHVLRQHRRRTPASATTLALDRVKAACHVCRGGRRDGGAHDGGGGGAAALPLGARPPLGRRRVLLLRHRPPLLHALRAAGAAPAMHASNAASCSCMMTSASTLNSSQHILVTSLALANRHGLQACSWIVSCNIRT